MNDGGEKVGLNPLLDEVRLRLLDRHVARLLVLDELHDHAAADLLAGPAGSLDEFDLVHPQILTRRAQGERGRGKHGARSRWYGPSGCF